MVARLTDGTRVVIREIRPSDKRLLVESRGRFSDETMRRRFMAAKPQLSNAELRYLTEVDGHDHHALVAVRLERLEELVAVARFVRSREDPTVAEAAIVVADELHRKGLGRRLALTLADAARDRGIQRFRASMLSDNPAALKLMGTLSQRLEVGPHEHGTRDAVTELAA